jgi:hypothetical protein
MKTISPAFVREAATWPSIRELAEEYGVRERWLRGLIETGKVEAIRLDVFRINPESWNAYLVQAHRKID